MWAQKVGNFLSRKKLQWKTGNLTYYEKMNLLVRAGQKYANSLIVIDSFLQKSTVVFR